MSLRFPLVSDSHNNEERERVVAQAIRVGMPRSLELVIAMVALVFSAPVLALAVAGIFLSSRGPVIFRQIRIGQRGRPFILYKLRTMRVSHAQGAEITAADDSRVLRLGRWLRKTKVDELPEFWNVLKGDMSLVGPRPEVERYVDQSNPAWRLVLQAKPGITDPVSLQLRSEEVLLASVQSDRERFYREVLQPFKLKGYLDYLQHRSWHSDLRVLCRTVVAIVLPATVTAPRLD